MMTRPNSLDLTSCDRERIHIIPNIQGHGSLVVVSLLDLKIRHLSLNTASFFGKDNSEFFVGRRLSDLIPEEIFPQVEDRLKQDRGPLTEGEFFKVSGPVAYDVFLFKLSEKLVGIEFERLERPFPLNSSVFNKINSYLLQMQTASSITEICNVACRAIRFVSGLDRVMVYKFMPPEMYGVVIGEDKIPSTHGFLDHRFPATDIPKPARDLYLKNHVRLIFDSQGEVSELFPKLTGEGEPLDLSNSRLRGVSPIHLEYLRNMGVRSSFSLAIIYEGKLWGLIACHHSETKTITHEERAQCMTIANSLALIVPERESQQERTHALAFNERLFALFTVLKQSDEPLNDLFKNGQIVRDLFNCAGFALVSSNKVDINGFGPRQSDLRRIWEIVIDKLNHSGAQVFYTDSLQAMAQDLDFLKEQVSGLLAIRLSEVSDELFILLRPELIQTIQWGGDPRKNIDSRNYQGVINPRSSFETWTQTIQHTSLQWTSIELKGAEVFRDLIFDSLVRKEALITELNQKLSAKKLP